MKFLVISDLHGNIEVLNKLDDVFKSVDAVLFAGDYAECFKTETSKPIMQALLKKHDTIFSVLGNCDEPSFIEELENNDISVEKSLVFYKGLSFIGSGGGTKFTGKTPNEREEQDILSDFNVLSNSEDNCDIWNSVILISHNPPKDTKCDSVNEFLHAGSQMFRDFIAEKKPLAVICGHIHEGVGIDSIGNTVIVNPGTLSEGNYAIIDISSEDGTYKVDSVELKKV